MVSPPDDPAAPPDRPTGSRSGRRGIVRAVAIGVVGALIGIGAYVVLDGGNDPVAAPAPVATTTTVASARAAEVYDAILPSVVFVRTDASSPQTGGIGSGVVFDDAGRVLTAHHVVDGASEIELTFADGSTSPATIVEADPTNDIAVLEPERLPELLVPAVLGGGVRVGDDVYPVGNPLGFAGTFTAGVVSGLDRSIVREDNGGPLEGLIQFDAAINPGSSGGPLVNRDAQVVGIVTALANPAGQRTFIGLGFAVPIATAGGAAAAIDR